MADRTEKRLTPEEIENLTCDLLRFFVKWGMYDNCIYSNGQRYTLAWPHSDEKTETFHDLPGVVIEKYAVCLAAYEWEFVKLTLERNGQQEHILTIDFDSILYEVLNYGVYELHDISILPEDARALLLKLDPMLYERITGYDEFEEEGPVLDPLEFETQEEYLEFEDVLRPPKPDVASLDWSGIDVCYEGYNKPVARTILDEFKGIFDKYGIWYDYATTSVLTCCY